MSVQKNESAVKSRQLRARVDYLVGARLRQRDMMAQAARVQDKLRAKRKKAIDFDVVSAIRASRDSR